MKPTLRKNGKIMVNVQIPFMLSREDLIDLLAARHNPTGIHDPIGSDTEKELSKGQVIEDIRTQLKWDPMASWRDELKENEAAEIEDWATRQLERAFARDFAEARRLAKELNIEIKER